MESRGTGGESSVRETFTPYGRWLIFFGCVTQAPRNVSFSIVFSSLWCGSGLVKRLSSRCELFQAARSWNERQNQQNRPSWHRRRKNNVNKASNRWGGTSPFNRSLSGCIFALHNKRDNCLRSRLLSNGSKIWRISLLSNRRGMQNGGFGAIFIDNFPPSRESISRAGST